MGRAEDVGWLGQRGADIIPGIEGMLGKGAGFGWML